MIAKLVSSFSLVLLCVFCFAADFKDLERELVGAHTPAQVRAVFEKFPDILKGDADLSDALEYVGDEYSVKEVQEMVSLRAASEAPANSNAATQIKAIKGNPMYRDPGIQDQSNWLEGALKRIGDLFPKNRNSDINAPNITAPNVGFLSALVPLVWVLLGVALLVFGYFAFRHVSWKRNLRRRAKAVLEDDEPERTLDEWLALADEHTANGNYREAVRAMYLSCLLKFDEAGIARFVRGETNWEHLSRIQASLKRPLNLDFLAPTKSFDRIWYGHHVKGIEDVQQFRAWYEQITEMLRGARR